MAGKISNIAALNADNFSLINLFFQADIVVQVVMVGLILASVWCWAIIIEKSIVLSRARRRADKFEGMFWSGQSLDELHEAASNQPRHPLSILFLAAMREWKRSQEGSRGKSLMSFNARLDKIMDVNIQKEMTRMERRVLFLATVGSTAPFVGLFGTVWGIMNSFQAIAISKNTNLAVVAPGIAEALFATALGLLAAIPAVIAYNKYSTDLSNFSMRMENFADEFSAILSRQLDQEEG